MDYRREIDGLRAIAVLPVMFFHAGFEAFRGGYVGVDVFFVISGYLITTIIVSELAQGRFSIVGFYERRARRILPALFLVMFVCLVGGYFLLMPDEFKNLGQSLVATTLFSNNVLLALTSGYWDLANEFKPLLHTWSVGVEEQYYLVVPVLLLLAWRWGRERIAYLFGAIFLASLVFAAWFVTVSPKWAFFLLPTRAWEISMGGLAALLLMARPRISEHAGIANALSLLGLGCIVASVLLFDESIPSPGPHLLIPTIGAGLIVLFARDGTLVHRLLGHRWVVFIGLLSYSLYLWHQPVFSFLRVSYAEAPDTVVFLGALPFVGLLAYLSWRFVEIPFRGKSRVTKNAVWLLSASCGVFFVAAGLHLNRSYGLPERAFDPGIRIEDMDKRIYNERAYSFSAAAFSDDARKKLLIIGDSFARDFTNITLETFDTSRVELVYTDEILRCVSSYHGAAAQRLLAKADVIVFAGAQVREECLSQDLAYAASRGKEIFYVGTKDFGYNLNWLIRLSPEERRNRYNTIPQKFVDADLAMRGAVPAEHYISLIAPVIVSGRMPITDGAGRMLSTDRAHLTKYGAIYFGERAVKTTRYAEVFR